MFLACSSSGAFQANCYVLATGPGSDCVIVDPGQDSAGWITQTCSDNRLAPVAVLATHGHLDHIADAATVCRAWQVPCWIHPADRHLLAEPMRGLPAEWRPALVELIGGDQLAEPEQVNSYDRHLRVAGFSFSVHDAPGHSAGSVVLEWEGEREANEQPQRWAFSGDVVFAGSVGRTDLPGSDPVAMATTLERLVATLPAATTLLPGHGPRTSMAAELETNPYLPR